MLLSLLARSRRSASVDDLVARGKYAKAVQLLRDEFTRRHPSAAERLRLADLLVLANRGAEALPILLGVADEQTRYGFPEKALEALRRAGEIDPSHPEVRQRARALKDKPPRPAGVEPSSRAGEPPDWGAALDSALPSSEPPEEPQTPGPATTEAASAGEAGPNGDAHPTEMFVPQSDLEPEEREPALGEVGAGSEEPTPLLSEADLIADEPRPLLTEAELDHDEPEPLVSEADLIADEPRPLLTEAELDHDEPTPLGAGVSPKADRIRPLLTEVDLDIDEAAGPEPGGRWDPADEELLSFVRTLGRTPGPGRLALGPALFAKLSREQLRRVAGGLTPHLFAPGDVVVSEGDPGHSLFLIATGSVRVLIMGGHGRPFDIRRLDAGDFFGEVALLTGRPRTATVVAATPCQMLEIERGALDALTRLRPAARKLLKGVGVSRTQTQEEAVVRSLPPEAADPERAAEALRAHFGSSEWSPRVRTHLARLMLDVGREDEALAILAGVAEDLARHGHAQKAVAILKKVESIRRRGIQEIRLAPLRPGRRPSARARASAAAPSATASASRAVSGAAFREWVGSLLRVTDDLAARPAPSPSVEEVAER